MPALEFGRDKEKFCQLFQKLRVVGRSPTALRGLQGAQPLPSPTPKKGGRMSPSWGATETALGAIACVLACRLGQR